jgi:hypothetical protein
MEFGTLILIAACIVTAAFVYFSLEYRMYGEREAAHNKLMRVQADAAAVRKELLGYTTYAQYVAATKQALIDKSKKISVKVVREYVYIENICQPPLLVVPIGVVILRYSCEFSFCFDLKSDNFEIAATETGLAVQVPKPIFANPPVVKAQPAEIPIEGVITDQIGVLAAANKQIGGLALQYGVFVSADPAILSLCTEKLADAVRAFIGSQPGVKQVPTIVVTYK